ncbi:MAG: AraC family transcriptional regulator [Bacillota bacterium]
MAEDLRERASYLRGFMEGIDLEEESKEQKVLHRMISLLEDLCDEVEQLRVDYDEMLEYTEALDEDLGDLEDDFYEEDEEEYEDEDYEGGFSIECPNCGEIVVVDDDILDQEGPIEVVCPGCGEKVLVDEGEWDEELDELLGEEEGEEEKKEDEGEKKE